MVQQLKFLVTTALMSVLFCQLSMARFSPYYSYDELVDMSDLVVLMEYKSTKATDVTDKDGGEGRETSAEILTVFKGKAENRKIIIRHFYYSLTPNAPNPVLFPPASANMCLIQSSLYRSTTFLTASRKYIAFLKRQTDGSYIPSSPHYDSALSFLTVGGDINILWRAPMEDSSILKIDGNQPKVRYFVEKPSF